MNKSSFLTLCFFFTSLLGFAQLYSDFPVTGEKSTFDTRLVGIWEIMPKEDPGSADLDPKELQSAGFVIIRSAEDNSFRLQILNKQQDASTVYYNSTEYTGYLSVLDNQLFLNLREMPMKDENQEDDPGFNSDSEQGYLIFKLEMTNGTFVLKTPVLPSGKVFNNQSSFTDFVKKNMYNSFFYHKEADYVDKRMVPFQPK